MSSKRRCWNPFRRAIRRALPPSASASALQAGLASGARDQAAAMAQYHRNEWPLLRFIALPRAGVAKWQSRPDLRLEKYIRLDGRRTE
jgi:hypothetical protein